MWLEHSPVAVVRPAVSVVIHVYSARSWIGETLESVFRQPYSLRNIELIVIDDGLSRRQRRSSRADSSPIDRWHPSGPLVDHDVDDNPVVRILEASAPATSAQR